MRYLLPIYILFAWQIAIAQDSTKTSQLAEVVVSANFQETEVKKAARSVEIISAQQISLAPVKTLDGILQYALNVDVRSRGPMAVQADISLRGGHYDQTLIMLDGVKLNDPQTGHHSLNLPISIDQIERIEVLQGGASRIFGPSAFAGVIHIISKKAQKTEGNLGLVYGNFALLKINPSLSLASEKASSTVSYEKISSDGFAYNTAFNRNNIFVNNRLNIGKKGQLQLMAGMLNNRFGASNFYAPSVKEQYEEVQAKLIALRYSQHISEHYFTNISVNYRRHNDFYDFNNFRKTAPNSVNLHQTDVYDANWIHKINTKLGTTTLGLEQRSEAVISNRLGENLVDKKEAETINNIQVFYTKGKTRQNSSIYLEQWKSWGKATITLGALYNINSQFGNAIFPGADVSLQLWPHSNWYLSANKSLRFPTFTEMYLTGATVIGNPNLQPEDAWLWESGIKHRSEKGSYNVSFFYRKSNNAIDKIKRPNLAVPTMEVIGDMNSYGLELSGLVPIHIAQFPLKQIRANYAYTYADKKEENYQSFYTLNYLRHKASIGLSSQLAKHLNLDIWYTYKKREGSFQYDAKSPITAYEPVKLVDVRLNWQQKNLKLFADVSNLFAYRYYEFGFVEQPGRWASLGTQISFK